MLTLIYKHKYQILLLLYHQFKYYPTISCKIIIDILKITFIFFFYYL